MPPYYFAETHLEAITKPKRRTYLNKISGTDRIALQREGGVIERTHWVAGVVPHPKSGGDTRINSNIAEEIFEEPPPPGIPEKNRI